MTKPTVNFTIPNQAWILHREEIETLQDGNCNVYVLIDAYSKFCFGQEISIDLPASSKILNILKTAFTSSGTWPMQILILKKDPFAETLQAICKDLKIPLQELPANDLRPFTQSFKDSFRQFKKGSQPADDFESISEIEQEELEAFIPETYSPCPCASGNKFKFCCQKIFKDITFAMCAAQEGKLEEALRFMKQAEEKVGRTAEILCRFGICWSFFDMKKSQEFLDEAIKLNPKHPRTNYILGIEAVDAEEYDKAIVFYQTAIDNYPLEDKFHLNETYNNQGTAYFELKKYKEAKEVWEKALVLLPLDQMVKDNLFEFIYENPDVPKGLREISPFIKKYLMR
jgi:tetratricopeptide (TPR) repeat protein